MRIGKIQNDRYNVSVTYEELNAIYHAMGNYAELMNAIMEQHIGIRLTENEAKIISKANELATIMRNVINYGVDAITICTNAPIIIAYICLCRSLFDDGFDIRKVIMLKGYTLTPSNKRYIPSCTKNIKPFALNIPNHFRQVAKQALAKPCKISIKFISYEVEWSAMNFPNLPIILYRQAVAFKYLRERCFRLSKPPFICVYKDHIIYVPHVILNVQYFFYVMVYILQIKV